MNTSRLIATLADSLMVWASGTLPSVAAPLDPPPGSYQNSCVQVIVQLLLGGSGRTLEARCPNRNGRYVDVAQALPCRGDIQNRNGALRCVPGPNPFALPTGDYQAKCRNINLAGPILTANCSTIVGAVRVETSINTLNCKGLDIRVNARGKLVC